MLFQKKSAHSGAPFINKLALAVDLISALWDGVKSVQRGGSSTPTKMAGSIRN